MADCQSCGRKTYNYPTPLCTQCAKTFLREFEKLREQKPVLSLSGERRIRP